MKSLIENKIEPIPWIGALDVPSANRTLCTLAEGGQGKKSSKGNLLLHICGNAPLSSISFILSGDLSWLVAANVIFLLVNER